MWINLVQLLIVASDHTLGVEVLIWNLFVPGFVITCPLDHVNCLPLFGCLMSNYGGDNMGILCAVDFFFFYFLFALLLYAICSKPVGRESIGKWDEIVVATS